MGFAHPLSFSYIIRASVVKFRQCAGARPLRALSFNRSHRLRRPPFTIFKAAHLPCLGKSPSTYDGDWIYWSTRRGRSPDVPPRVAKLLRKQDGRCIECQLYLHDGDAIEVAYINPSATRGREAGYNLMLLHHHCREQREAEFALVRGVRMTNVNRPRSGMTVTPHVRF